MTTTADASSLQHGDDTSAPSVLEQLPVASGRRVAAHLLGLLRRRYGRAFAGTALLHIAAAAVALGPPILLGRMIDTVAADGAGAALVGTVDGLAVGIAALLAAQTVLAWAAALAMGVLAERFLAELRSGFLGDVVHLPLSTVERAGTGDLLSRTSSDVDAVHDGLRAAVPEIFAAVVSIVLLLAGAVWVSPLMALSVLVVLPVLLPAVRWYRRRAPQAFADLRSRTAAIAATLNESSAGARTVETLGWRRRRTARLSADVARCWQVVRRIFGLRTVLFPATDLTMFLPLLACLVVGGGLAVQGLVSVGEAATVAVFMQMLMAPMTQIILSLDDLQMGNAALARLVGVGGLGGEDRGSPRDPAEEPDTDIRVQGVHFGYGVDGAADGDVLHGIDLTLRRGERLALVGPTGAGKSTLARLLVGIHPPREGAVAVGGVPLVELPPERLRRRVGLLTQEHHVFVGTLADNLRLAAPDADDAHLLRALERVGGAAWLARLPHGLQTELVGDHVAPTPAEAQLIALARLAVAAPPTLVLDEATSQLDAGAARRAESALAEILHGRTVVMIAHRLHTAHDADRIGVIEHGRLTELGTHDELLAAGGAYRRLWEAWHGGAPPAIRTR